MGLTAEKAVKFYEEHRGNCAQAIAATFGEYFGKDSASAAASAAAMGGGRAVICGAVASAESLLGELPSGEELSAELRRAFTETIGALNCREIKSETASPCALCVRVCAEQLEKLLEANSRKN